MERLLNGHAELAAELELVAEIVNDELYEYYPLGKYVVRAPGVCGGRPTFKYTRIDVDFVLSQLVYDQAIAEIVADYAHPHLTEDAIKEALKLAVSAFQSYYQAPLVGAELQQTR